MRTALYVLGQLRDLDVAWIGSAGRRLTLEPGQMLIRRGTPLANLFFVLVGQLAVNDGRRDVAHLGPGDMADEMSLVEARPPSASVHAVKPSLVLELNHRRLADRLDADTAFAARMYRAIAITLSARLRAGVPEPEGAGAPASKLPPDHDEIDLVALDGIHHAGRHLDNLLRQLTAGTT